MARSNYDSAESRAEATAWRAADAAEAARADTISGAVPTDDEPGATVVADVPGASGTFDPTVPAGDPDHGWGWLVDAATLTFADIGASGDGTPVAQIVVYVGRPVTYAASIELTAADATALAERLTAWVGETTGESPSISKIRRAHALLDAVTDEVLAASVTREVAQLADLIERIDNLEV